MSHADAVFTPVAVAVLTVSGKHTLASDSAGQWLAEAVTAAGHQLVERQLVGENLYAIRAQLSAWILSAEVNAVLINGGTGLTARDFTPEAVRPLLDKEVEGFGELFRQLSFAEIGSAALQSRALAGVANRTVIFCLPGSPSGCRTAWPLIAPQLDSRTRPCNFVPHIGQGARGGCP